MRHRNYATTLPPDVWVRIFSMLSTYDRLKVIPAVCRTWRNIINNPQVWPAIAIGTGPPSLPWEQRDRTPRLFLPPNISLASVISHRFGLLESLSLGPLVELSTDELEAVAVTCEHLIHLHATVRLVATPESSDSASSESPSLLRRFFQRVSSYTPGRSTSPTNSISHMIPPAFPTEPVIRLCSRLVSLSLELTCGVLSDNKLEKDGAWLFPIYRKIIGACSSLRHCRFVRFLDDDGLAAISSYGSLETAHFEYCQSLRSESMTLLLSRCPALTDLSLRNCDHLMCGQWVRFLSSSNRLRRFLRQWDYSISTPNVDDWWSKLFIDRCKHLETLSLGSPWQPDSYVLDPAVSSIPFTIFSTLMYLHICARVSGTALATALTSCTALRVLCLSSLEGLDHILSSVLESCPELIALSITSTAGTGSLPRLASAGESATNLRSLELTKCSLSPHPIRSQDQNHHHHHQQQHHPHHHPFPRLQYLALTDCSSSASAGDEDLAHLVVGGYAPLLETVVIDTPTLERFSGTTWSDFTRLNAPMRVYTVPQGCVACRLISRTMFPYSQKDPESAAFPHL